MPRDLSPLIWPQVFRLLGDAAALVERIPTARHYGLERPSQPVKPFLSRGVAVRSPFAASRLDGTTVLFALHVFTETTGKGDDTLGGEEAADLLLAIIVETLGGDIGVFADLDDGSRMHLTWAGGTQVVRDGDDSAFHGFAQFRATITKGTDQ